MSHVDEKRATGSNSRLVLTGRCTFPESASLETRIGDDALIETNAGRDWSIEESNPLVVPIVSRISIRESSWRTAFLRDVIGSQITRNLRARFGVPSPCHQVIFRTEKGCADESNIGSQKRLKDGNAYHYGVRSSLPIC